jgi:hypothetical protein
MGEYIECTVTTRHMLTVLGMSTWCIGCEHKDLAVVSVSEVDRVMYVNLLLENKTVTWRYARGRVAIDESTERG